MPWSPSHASSPNSRGHLLTKNRDYLYAVPKRTIDKRSAWRLMAKRRAGIELASAAKRPEGRNVLYGTGEAGTKLKREIVRHAAARAERLYAALVKERRSADKDEGGLRSEDLVFDPLTPVQADWEKILAEVAVMLIAKRRKPA